jgi:acyl-CoA dehydrogenase
MRLSVDDLGVFFDERHVALGAELRRVGGLLASGTDGAPAGEREAPAAPAAAIARALGAEHGLYALLVPESLGGARAGRPDDPTYIDVRSLCLAREMLGYVSPMADSIFAVQGLGSYPVVLAGTAEQRARILPGVLSGERVGAFALTEPEAGSDVAAMKTVAVRQHDGGYVLDGEKVFISNVGLASHHVVFANANPAEGRRGITAFLVERGAPGLIESPIALAVEHPIGRLRFEGCRVPASALLGREGEGFKLAMRTLDAFRVTVGAAAVGMARRALDETIGRVKLRVQFGKALAEQPVVQSILAEMATELDASRLLVLRAAHARDGGQARVSTEAAMAKLFATEAAQRIIDKAVQLHGGLGVTAGQVVERLYREIRPLRIYEGTSEIQRLIIGAALVREGA